MVVIETSDDSLEKARRDGAEVFIGNAADPEILAAANLAGARRLFVTIPEPFEAGQVVAAGARRPIRRSRSWRAPIRTRRSSI